MLVNRHSPIDGRFLESVYYCDKNDVDKAVLKARRAFQSGSWSNKTPKERKEVLKRWGQLLRNHLNELALLETLDSGKPISATTSSDVPGAIDCLEWFAEVIDKTHGAVIPSEQNFLSMVTREPLGVVAAIVPWNYPLLMAMWKLAPSLAMGNSVLLKPSEKTPLSAIYIAKLALEAGLPKDVLTVLPGRGDVGAFLSHHLDIDAISFTGSGKTGRKIMIASASSNLKRVSLELGGKSPNIILPDYPDLKRAARSAAAAIFMNAGAICSAGSRLLLHRNIKEKVLELLLEESQAFQPGDPLNPATTVGAIIDEIHLKYILNGIEKGKKEAKLLLGGKQVRKESGGFYIEPTIFDCPHHKVSIAKEEIFGPVLSVITYDTIEEAIKIANDTEYGLAAAVWSGDTGFGLKIAKDLRAGSVWVNHYDDLSDTNLPFGGYKQSGFGRDNSIHALEKYSEIKATVLYTE